MFHVIAHGTEYFIGSFRDCTSFLLRLHDDEAKIISL